MWEKILPTAQVLCPTAGWGLESPLDTPLMSLGCSLVRGDAVWSQA